MRILLALKKKTYDGNMHATALQAHSIASYLLVIKITRPIKVTRIYGTHFATQNVKMTFWVGGWVFKILFDVLRGSLFLEDKIP